MRVSLNEIQTVVFKACVAVGLPMGISQDASQAAGHVYPQYRGCIKPFTEAISAVDKNHSDKYNIPQATRGIFRSIKNGKILSSLYTAPTVCDQILVRNKNNQAPSIITLMELDVPVIVIFHIALITMFINNKVSINWQVDQGDTIQGVCQDGNIIFNRGGYEELLLLRDSSLILNIPNYISSLLFPNKINPNSLDNLNIDSPTWECLTDYANRLLVTSSDTSRMVGAGAGVIDMD
jgi:hypothetical protein